MGLQLPLCMSSPLRKDGRKGPGHLPLLPQQGGGLLLCCFRYSCFWGHLISLPMLSLWGAPKKTIRNQVCMRVPSHLGPRAPRRTPCGLLLWLPLPRAPRMPHPQQGHVPWHRSTVAPQPQVAVLNMAPNFRGAILKWHPFQDGTQVLSYIPRQRSRHSGARKQSGHSKMAHEFSMSLQDDILGFSCHPKMAPRFQIAIPKSLLRARQACQNGVQILVGRFKMVGTWARSSHPKMATVFQEAILNALMR